MHNIDTEPEIMKDFSPEDRPDEVDHSSKNDYVSVRKRIFTAAVLILMPLIYFYPAVIGKTTLAPGDGWTQILGIRVLIGEMIKNGQLPFWNPFIFSGMPLMASIQPGALYPPSWLFAVLSPQVAMNMMVITTYHIALIGTYLYARRIGCNRVGSMIAGIAFAFGGYMVSHLGHTNRIAAAAWTPWIVLAIEELYLRLRWRWVAFGALFIALQILAGEPQVTCYTVMAAGAYGLFSLTLREAREDRRRFLFGAVAMSVCGSLMSAIQLLPSRELLKLGERAALTYEYFSGFSLPPRQIFQGIFPYFFGGAGTAPYKIAYWGMWNPTEVASYVGMTAMIFTLIVLISQFTQERHNRLVWFWAGCAVVAVLLAFGSYLPFGIHKFLYHVPVYKLFRAQGRHILEFNFAMGALAGLGATWVSQNRGRVAWRVILAGIVLMSVIVGVTAIVYRFFANHLVMDLPLTEGAQSFANPELLIPVSFFVLSALAIVIYALYSERSAILKTVLSIAVVALLFADVASWGFFYEWKIVPSDLPNRLADTPTVKFIKERESDLNSFRVLSHGSQPYGRNYEMLDYPNISIVRDLQSANGYDPLVISRYSALAGGMSLVGDVREKSAFDPYDQSFNLLNVKYLLLENPELEGIKASTERNGIRFLEEPINLVLRQGKQTVLEAHAMATEIAIISALGNSTQVPDSALVATVNIYTKDGRVFERQMLAGRDTAEWAYDRADVRAMVKHSRAPIIESFPEIPGEGFQGHYYIARFSFDRSEIERVVLQGETKDAGVTIVRASLHDLQTGQSAPLGRLELPPDRWRKLAEFGEIKILENTKALPRAWFVRRAAVENGPDLLKTIKNGMMKDGSAFDPAETVLFEREDFGNRPITLPQIGDPANAEVKVTRYEPQRIELQTRNSQPGFLVLSEIYYRGWEARIDGHSAPIERVDYMLRGLAVPAGDHRIEFVFRAHSFRTGLACSLLGVLLLLAGAHRRTRGVLAKIDRLGKINP
jgi:hypothetical protein